MEKKMISGTIEVEKFERKPGIYMIFNKASNGIYIGQAKDLKSRMVQHVQDLFKGKDNNINLQTVCFG